LRSDSIPPRTDDDVDSQPDDARQIAIRIEEIRRLEQEIVAKKQSLMLGPSGMALDEAAEELSFLLLRAGGKLLALSITYVEEVVQMPALEATDDEMRAVAGLANYHGEVIAVIDVAEIATGKRSTLSPEMAMVISQLRPRRLGLMVDEAVDVVTVPRAALSASDEVLPGAIKAAGVLQLPGETALVVDMLWMSLGAELANLLSGDAATPTAGDER
jgi:chemotaxis signal transduction protein